MTRRPITLIFDFDGTLADTSGLITKTLRETLMAVGMKPASIEACKATIGLPLYQAFQVLTGRDEVFCHHCADVYAQEIFPINNSQMKVEAFPYVAEGIRQLNDEGYHLALASSRRRTSILSLLPQMHLDGFFPIILGAQEVLHPKPAPDMVLNILEQTGSQKEDALVIGDTKYDVEMGRNAGCRTCGVTYGTGTRESLVSSKADFIVDDFQGVVNLLSSLF